ncbi:MAG: SgcJ/EcaC family oxidoreductase [Planctomycetaceae bacterium]|nr:SgcJ/EcaC family oxidoreductase [Planctomycetaceae bacterium]
MKRPLLLFSLMSVAMLSEASAQEARSKPQVPSAGADAHAKDRTAIRDTLASLAKAFEARDAKKLAAHWTSEGEHQTVRGETVRGRDALEQGFGEFFAVTPEVVAEVRSESLRFLSKDSAIDEGVVTIRKGSTAPATRARYRALLVREDDRWRLAILGESPEDGVSIGDLGWLIGEWKSTSGGGADIRTTYTWDANQKFIHVQFAIKEGDRALSGKQVIGVDPATGAIHSWTFEANGGIGEADWSRDGDHWVLAAAATLPDGGTLVQTNILTRVNADTFTWQSTERTLDDNELPDLAPVKVTRIKSEK